MHGPGRGPVKAGDCRGKGECTAQGGDLLKLEIAAEKVSAGPGRGPVKAGECGGKGECTAQGGDLLKLENAVEKVSGGC